MSRQVALLRGVNVGTRRPVAMADLRAVVEGLGGRDARTHLRSGNVVYGSPHPPARMAALLGRSMADAFGFEVPVVVRTAPQMRRLVDANPLVEQAARDPARLQLVFLSARPPEDALAGIEDEEVGDDVIRVTAREVWVWSPDGITGSPALAALERRRIPVVATARNWRTVERLVAMLEGSA